MNFAFTEEQEEFREEIRDFCQTTPYGEIDIRISSDFSAEFYRKVADRGWIGLAFPREYGGQGRSKMDETLFHEEMAAHRAPICWGSYGTSVVLGGAILLKRGSEEQKKHYLPGMARGEMWTGQGFTEPNAGSDLLSLSTRAIRKGDHYMVNGEKTFQTWAQRARYLSQHGMTMHVMLLAKTALSAPPDKSLSMFIFDVTEFLPGMSMRPIITPHDVTAQVFFDNVEIPVDSLIGVENQAWDYVVESGVYYWDRRPGYFIGLMRGLLRDLVQYVKETQVDGRPLSENPLVRHKLAEMAIRRASCKKRCRGGFLSAGGYDGLL